MLAAEDCASTDAARTYLQRVETAKRLAIAIARSRSTGVEIMHIEGRAGGIVGQWRPYQISRYRHALGPQHPFRRLPSNPGVDLDPLAIGMKDWTKMTDEQFKQASDFLRKVHKNVRFYWSDGTQLSQAMANGEVIMSWAWNETPTTMQAEGHPVASSKDAKEGLSTWVCGFVLLKDGEGSEDKAYDYINAFLEERSANYMVDAWGYGHANGSALDKMDKKLLESKGFGDIANYFSNSLFQAPTDKAD